MPICVRAPNTVVLKTKPSLPLSRMMPISTLYRVQMYSPASVTLRSLMRRASVASMEMRPRLRSLTFSAFRGLSLYFQLTLVSRLALRRERRGLETTSRSGLGPFKDSWFSYVLLFIF
ncbi:hypothetical protein AVEN_24374-1 [Araneus ventricosus]|uniref:Uncharacterized protein n=1 Tax=Araneus ventricosus TaxID=182803 RepID=A0A4Y2HUU8_ARAVE|nr:hypothetical protein AVEN_24374-1 [Araneus ventricosus]